MDKLAHYRAVAFVDELEKIAGYEFDDDVREYLYKEAAFNLAATMDKVKKIGTTLTHKSGEVAQKLQNQAMKAQMSPGGQKFMGSAMSGGMQTPSDMILGGLGAATTQAGQMFGGKAGGWMNTFGNIVS